MQLQCVPTKALQEGEVSHERICSSSCQPARPKFLGNIRHGERNLPTQGRGRDNRQQTLSLWMRRGVISGMIEGHSPLVNLRRSMIVFCTGMQFLDVSWLRHVPPCCPPSPAQATSPAKSVSRLPTLTLMRIRWNRQPSSGRQDGTR